MAESRKWIQRAIRHRFALHEQLGVPKDKKIPTSMLRQVIARLRRKAKKTKLTDRELKLLRRAVLAMRLRKMNKNR